MAWKPEMAPQATVMNMKAQMGVPLGCMLWKLEKISGIFSPLVRVPKQTPMAMMIRQMPNRGYTLPMTLSTEMKVAMK